MTGRTFPHLRLLATLLLAGAWPHSADAQNSSLLHAPSAGTVAPRVPQDGANSVRVSRRPPTGVVSARTSETGAGAGAAAAIDARGQLTGALRQFAGTEAAPAEAPFAADRAQPPSDDTPRRPLSLGDVSWTHRPAPALRTFEINDIVTIRVDEMSRMMAEGESESRKRTMFEAILTDWIKLDDWRLRPDPQGNGDPTVGNESNTRVRNESALETQESLSFNIAARVVDIRPNGNLVLEARKTYRVNDNQWETALTGICRAKDIAADNVVLSRDMIDLQIIKQDQGQLREGYRRGWFSRLLDRMQPF